MVLYFMGNNFEMRIVPGLHVEWVGDEAVVLNPDSKELHYLNGSAAIFFALLEEEGYPEALTHLQQRFKGQDIDEEIKGLVTDMVERGLLTDD